VANAPSADMNSGPVSGLMTRSASMKGSTAFHTATVRARSSAVNSFSAIRSKIIMHTELLEELTFSPP
jgi:hypothetical protein